MWNLLLHHALPHHTTTWLCDMEWRMMWCGAMWSVTEHTMLCHITPPHGVRYGMGMWNVVWCDVECVTMLPHHALTQHTTTYYTTQPLISTLHHTTAAEFHISSCYTVQTMLCHIAPPPIAHYEMWCDVSFDREWCMKWSVVWCGMRCDAQF